MKNKAYNKDIRRSILKSKKRFLSILIITALGVTVLCGIYAACQDMYHSADTFYDRQQLFDIRVLSTLGLTDEDVEELQAVTGIEVADGGYSETVHTTVGDARQSAALTALSARGLNTPYVLEGALPAAAGEIAVTQDYLDATGKSIGDSLTIEEEFDEDDEADGAGTEPEEPEAEPEVTPEEPEADEDDSLSTDIDWDADVEVEEEAETPNFLRDTFTITAVVLDPMDISSSDGVVSFRATAGADYTFFITPQDVETDVYTAVYLRLAGLAGLNCYSDEYEAEVGSVISLIEKQIMTQREQARYDAVMGEALDKIGDAESTMDEKFSEADEQFSEAWADVEEAKKELLDGEAELTAEERDALQKLADARAEIEDGKQQLRDAETELDDSEKQLLDGEKELDKNAQTLADGKKELEKNRTQVKTALASVNDGLNQAQLGIETANSSIVGLKAVFGESWPEAAFNDLVNAAAAEAAAQMAADPTATPDVSAATSAQQAALAQAIAAIGDDTLSGLTQSCVAAAIGLGTLNGSQTALNAQKTTLEAALKEIDKNAAEIAAGENTIAEKRKEIADGKTQIKAGREEVGERWQELLDGEAELDTEEAKALRELADAWQEIADGKQELAEGEAELTENEQKYQDKKAEAEQKIADAYAELEDIDMTQWYVQDRTSLDSFSNLKSDMGSIEAVGNAFPVVFLIVAILISLTTMTRMVEEDRGLIGTYKALGFGDAAIYRKYLIYAFLACTLGAVLGDLLGFIALPLFLSTILSMLYTLPHFVLGFDWLYGLGGAALFMVSIVGATALACKGELKQMPAQLMRPKAPRAGSRVFLERIPAIWDRLKFLNKVTLRNLFRYKKRMFMTVAGILGCTALVLAGFAIKDSVTDLMPSQYERIYRYDLLVVADGEDNADLLDLLAESSAVTDSLNMQISNAKVLVGDAASENLQLMVVPTGESIDSYIHLSRADGGGTASLDDSGILLTQNAAELLGLSVGDTLTLQSLQLDQYDTTLSGIVENYLGNTVYITQTLYQNLFGDYAPNGALAHLSGTPDEQMAFADTLLEDNIVLSSISTEALKADFSTSFTLINSVVYVLIVLAAGLAFVVLFTLSNTNISERIRELATIKVLGFYDGEVHAYVNKETLILTAMGVILGLPVGRWISGLLTEALKLPSLYFAVSVHPASYVIAGVISFSFALVVNLMTNRTLDAINMVEALKSVE